MILRNGLRILLLSLFILLFSHSPSHADTAVGGRIAADTTWTLANSPYLVTSTVQVYGSTTSPVTLTIEPGVVVKFNSGTSLQIGYGTSQGALIAQGTADSHITFTRSGTSGTWNGFNFQDGTIDGTTVLAYSDVQYSTGVTISSASPTIRNSTITNVTGYGLNLTSSNPTIDTVTITNTGSYGIYLSSSSPTITNGSLTNSSATGYGIYGSGSPVISNYNVSIVNTAAYYGLYLSSTTSALSLTSSTIANGLFIGSASITPTVTGNTFTNSDNSPIHAGANIVAQILGGNTINNMTSAGRIEVVGEQVKQDARWQQWPAPYVVVSGMLSVYKDTTGPATLTLDPGVTVKFTSSSGLQIGNGTSQGAIIARGTTTNHITLTRNAISGTWWGISFQDGTIDSTTVFEYVDVQYSGGVDMLSASPTIRYSTIMNPNAYGLNLSSSNPSLDTVAITSNGSYGINLSSSSPTISGGSLTNTSTTGQGISGSGSPVISNYSVSIVNSAGKYGVYLSGTTSSFSLTNSTIANGLYIGSTTITPTITSNTFTNSDNSPIHAGANIIAQIFTGNTITGMSSAGRIEVVGEQVSQDAEWKQWSAPYVVTSGTVAVYKNTSASATLTIDAGVTVKFASGAGLQIGNGTNQGALVARGTSTDRITFTRSATSGTWGSITFNDGTVDNATVLENVDMQYSTGITMSSASPVLRNCNILNVTGYVNLSSSNPTLENVTITNTGSYGIYLTSSSPIITGGSLTNSSATGHGIYGNGSPVISNYNVSIVNAANYYGCYLSSGSTSSLSITNSSISNGLYLGTTGITPTITGNTFTNVDSSPIHAGANIIGQILSANTINNMTSAGRIEVVGEQVKQDAHWTAWPAPYVVTSGTVSVYKDTTGPATLTIDPGVTVKFPSGYGLQIGSGANQGALIAPGTSANHITFTRSGTSGTWAGFTFYDGTVDSATVLENVDVQYSSGVAITSASPVFRNCTITDMAGYVSLSSANPTLENVTITNSNAYGIYLTSSSPIITGGSITNTYPTGQGIYGNGSPIISNYSVSIVNSTGKYGINLATTSSSFSLTNSTIANGLYIGSINITPTITGNTFSNVDNSPIHAGANIIGSILNNNTINGMTSAGKIEVVGEQVPQNAQWKKWSAPYVVVSGTVLVYKDASSASTLTVDPGTVIKFATNTSLQIGNSSYKGALIAKGTGDNRISFTSSQATPAPGNWYGVTLYGDAAGASVIEYVIFEYAGTGANYNNANLTLNSTAPVIRNCISRNSAGSGIYISSAANYPVVMDSEITGNKWGVYSTSSNPYITNTKITGNTTAGVTNASTTVDIDARDNWWGAASGPKHTSNTNGTGDAISDHVIYNPWLGQTPGTGFAITEAKALPASLNPDGDYITFTAKLSTSGNWTVTITDGNNATVRTFTGSGTVISQKWYGENDQGAKVADGAYYYKIEATNPATSETASAPQGMLVASRLIPIAILESPLDNELFVGGTTINITGTASDSTDFKNYKLEYGAGENPSTWTSVKSSTTPITSGLIYALNTTTLTNSVYTLRLAVTDIAGNVAIETARVRLSWIQNVAATEGYISPNGDGIKDSTQVTATFSQQTNWTLTFKNASGLAVRTYTGTGSSMAQTWDGKDEAGQVVPDGSYTYRIDAMGGFVTGSLVVDTALPAAVITSPVANTALWNAVQIIGTASDTNFDNYKLEYGPAGGTGPWISIATATSSVSGGTLATWTTNDQTNAVLLQNGSYVLRLTVIDKAGNSSIVTVPVGVDNLILSNISASSHTINTYANESSAISFNINEPATVTLKIIPEKQGPTGTPIYQTSQAIAAAGSYVFTWDGKDSTGKVVPDEAYLYFIEATDGTRSDTYSPPAPTGTGTVTCSKSTGFDPAKNLPLTVTYTPAQPSRVNINIAWASQNFKIQDAVAVIAGSHTYIWDGRNPSNKLLDSGAQSSCSIASLLRENYIITTGDTITATDLKTDPYTMYLSYGNITQITYTLPRDANVTVKISSPSGVAVTLVNNQLQTAGQQEITWNGLDTTDATGKKTLITEEGDYMVSVQVTNPVTGTSSTTRGNLMIGY